MLDAFYLNTDDPSDATFYDLLAFSKDNLQILQTTLQQRSLLRVIR